MAPDVAAKLADSYAERMVAALDQYEEHKAMYAAVQQAYRIPGRAPEVAERRAASDTRLAQAAALGPWYREEAVAYAAAVTALMAIAASGEA